MTQEQGRPAARPQPQYATDLETLKKEVRVETYRGRGPGGQRKNKTETAVRLTHIPSGVVVTASKGRYQAQNRELAFERLQKRLERLNRRERLRLRTTPPNNAAKERAKEKKQRAEKKVLRRPPEMPEPM